MNSEVEITLRIEKIRHIFQVAQAVAELENDLNKIAAYCNNKDPEFRSIAFEAAAMALASKDLSEGSNLQRWSQFANSKAQAHLPQVHAALGWALAQQRVINLSLIDITDPLLLCRVLDGYGYYDGLFRQRQAITNQVIPDHIDEQLQKGYDQGVGRSLWYISKGSVEKMLSLISAFPPYRHQDLWRGVGIACVYVGGCDEDTLCDLSASAGICRIQLAIGSVLVASARHRASAPTPDSDLACRTWCNCSAEEAVLITQNMESDDETPPLATFSDWLLQIENRLSSIQLINNI